MRSFASIAVLGTLALAGSAFAQSLAEHAAAAAGATVGTAAGKPISNALSNIFGNVDQTTATAAAGAGKAKTTAVANSTISSDKATPRTGSTANTAGAPGGLSSSPGAPIAPAHARGGRTSASRQGAAQSQFASPIVPVVRVAEPVKEPSLEEVASVQLGTSEKDLFATLGLPESHVIVPDDDGHMRESCQYWSKGRQLGTIRLDNGQVVKVEVRAQN